MAALRYDWEVRPLWIGMAALLLAGCEKADNAPGPGGVTVGEARALDEAAQMIEAQRPPPAILTPSPPRRTAQASEASEATRR